MKQFITSRILVFKICLVVIGVIMAVTTFKDAAAIWKNDIGKIYSKGIDDYQEGELVSGKIEYVYGPIATLESTRTVYGIPVKKELTPYYLCLVPYDEKTGTEEYYIIVHASNKKTIKAMDELAKSGVLIDSGNSQFIECKTAVIPDDVKQYALEVAGVEDTTMDDLDQILAGYMLEEMDYSWAKFYPLFGILLAAAPIVLHIISKRRAHAYKSKRQHYVQQYDSPDFNTAPTDRNGNAAAPVRRYSTESYATHTRARGQTAGEQDAQQLGEMDSINTDDLRF